MTQLLLSVPEAAAELGVSRRTAYRLIQEGELATVLVRKRIRITPAALAEYVKAQTYPALRRAN